MYLQLPDMYLAVNARSEGRVLVPWEMRHNPNITMQDLTGELLSLSFYTLARVLSVCFSVPVPAPGLVSSFAPLVAPSFVYAVSRASASLRQYDD